MLEVGLSLSCIKKYVLDNKTFLDTAILLKDIGYKYLEYDLNNFNAKNLKKIIDESKININLINTTLDKLNKDLVNLMKDYNFINCKNISINSFIIDNLKDERKIKNNINKLNDIAKLLNNNGFKLFYHLSLSDFLSFKDNVLIIDYMLDNATYINYIFDPYIIHLAGLNIKDYIIKMKNKIDFMYLKNYKLVCNNNNINIIPTIYDDGSFNYNELFPLLKKANVKYYLISNDNIENNNIFMYLKNIFDKLK